MQMRVTGCGEGRVAATSGCPGSFVMIEALAGVGLAATFDPHRIIYLPGGKQRIVPVKGPKGVIVEVTRDTADVMEAHRQAVEAASGKRCYFDFRHEDREASFWPKHFEWDESANAVVALGDYSDVGESGVKGKRWREFSPRFFVSGDGTDQSPARVMVNPKAKPNLGGLVNDGAFDGTALWAARSDPSDPSDPSDNLAGAAGSIAATTNADTILMKKTVEEVAALKANQSKLEGEIQALRATVTANEKDELAKARLAQKEAEHRAAAAEIQAAASNAEADTAKGQVRAQNTALAKAAIAAAKKRGAIPTQGDKATEIEARYLSLIEADSSNVVLVETLPGSEVLAGRMTSGSAQPRVEGGFSAKGALGKFAEIVSRNTLRMGPGQKLDAQTAESKNSSPSKPPAITAPSSRLTTAIGPTPPSVKSWRPPTPTPSARWRASWSSSAACPCISISSRC